MKASVKALESPMSLDCLAVSRPVMTAARKALGLCEGSLRPFRCWGPCIYRITRDSGAASCADPTCRRVIPFCSCELLKCFLPGKTILVIISTVLRCDGHLGICNCGFRERPGHTVGLNTSVFPWTPLLQSSLSCHWGIRSAQLSLKAKLYVEPSTAHAWVCSALLFHGSLTPPHTVVFCSGSPTLLMKVSRRMTSPLES